MRKERLVNIGFTICIVALLLFTVVSRAVGLTYNLSMHPDESEFYNGSQSLAQSLLNPDVPFVEEKEYPEGGYVLQLPFQLIREILGSSHWFWRASHCWSRISSLFYFVLAMVYGIVILTKYMSRSRVAGILYGLTMCFSLFFIEHSRYGVGDMGSLWLLMATVYHCARALETKKRIHLVLAFFCTGAMAAVKYPQIFFVVLPLGTYLHMGGRNRKNLAGLAAFLLIAVLGLMMFSPKAALDPGYFLRVLDREGKAYVTEGTGFNSGGVINNIIGTVLYTLLYSDFPLSFLLVAACFGRFFMSPSSGEEPDFLFQKLLPAATAVFFAYNLFVKLLVFRTLTPFFGMTALYASEAAGKLCSYRDGRGRKIGWIPVAVLTCLMILRGGCLLHLTGQQGDEKDPFTALFSASVDENWNRATLLTPYNVASQYSFGDYLSCPEDLSVKELPIEKYAGEEGGLTIRPGELVVTGSYEYGLMSPYIVPYKKSMTAFGDRRWAEFKEANQEYYVGQLYPSGYYYLFGGWIRGGTLSTFLMPCNMVYYRSA